MTAYPQIPTLEPELILEEAPFVHWHFSLLIAFREEPLANLELPEGDLDLEAVLGTTNIGSTLGSYDIPAINFTDSNDSTPPTGLAGIAINFTSHPSSLDRIDTTLLLGSRYTASAPTTQEEASADRAHHRFKDTDQ